MKTALVGIYLMATTVILASCSGSEDAQTETTESSDKIVQAGLCRPQTTTSCGQWSSCVCVLVELYTGNCLRRSQSRSCTDYHTDAHCLTTQHSYSVYRDC